MIVKISMKNQVELQAFCFVQRHDLNGGIISSLKPSKFFGILANNSKLHSTIR